MFEIIGLISLCFAIAGVILNNRKMIICFPIWAVSNIIYLGMHWYLGSWSLVLRDVIYFGFSIEGYLLWRRRKK